MSLKVKIENLSYINDIFSLCLDENAPVYKLAFIGNGDHYLYRTFTVEEKLGIITLVKNVEFKKNGVLQYRRSTYMIPQSKIKMIHYQTGKSVNDLFDYATLEQDTNLYFYYNNQMITINEVLRIHKYKEVCQIYFMSENQYYLIDPKDFYSYAVYVNYLASYKLAYHIPDEQIPYLHVIDFINRCFSPKLNHEDIYRDLINDRQNGLLNLVNKEWEDIDNELAPVKKSNTFINVSLIHKLSQTKDLQTKRIIIGWFLCEIMYGLFFTDA